MTEGVSASYMSLLYTGDKWELRDPAGSRDLGDQKAWGNQKVEGTKIREGQETWGTKRLGDQKPWRTKRPGGTKKSENQETWLGAGPRNLIGSRDLRASTYLKDPRCLETERSGNQENQKGQGIR